MSINERGEFVRENNAPEREVLPKDQDGQNLESKYMYPGDEILKEKDRKLNVAFREFNEIASRLDSVSNVIVREADPDSGPNYESARVNTDKLSIAKGYMARMAQLIKEIERIEGIIDTKPVRKELTSSSGTEKE
jgi:hypothetical protein